MNKRLLYLIIFLISFSLLGLTALQVYWIRNAIMVREAVFVQSVDDAMSNVIIKLEKIEMAQRMDQNSEYYQSGVNLLQSIDSINTELYNEFQAVSNMEEYENYVRKSLMAQDIIAEMLNIKQNVPVEERINALMLDTLIESELNVRGINTQYEFGVYNPALNQMVIQKTGMFPYELLNKSRIYSLFPGEINNSNNYLMIYFPKGRQFLIKQMWGMLSIAALFILVIIVSFTFAINSIFKQKKLSDMKNDFINNMTHEFKTPISTISLACEALKDKDIIKTESLYDSYISVISEENQRLGSMSQKILENAVLEKGNLQLKKDWVDIHKILGDAINKIKLQVEKKGGKVYKDFQADHEMVKADKLHLTNTFLNILENANKYTLDQPEILVSTKDEEDGIRVSIRDNGIGISKANQKKIFDKLYRVSTGNVHNFKGFGLGLSYVKAIVDKHQGSINLDSELKKGTTFEIFLPFGD